MKTKSVAGWATLICGLAACSGRYEVGGEGTQPVDSAAGNGGSSASGQAATVGGGSGAGPGAFGGSGGVFAGESPQVDFCKGALAPSPLEADLPEPAVIWERVSRLVEGEGAVPPIALPSVATHAWVDELVSQAFVRARSTGAADGARAVVVTWLYRDVEPPEAPFEVDWGQLLIADEPALQQLMLEPVGEHGYGVFSEPSLLRRFPSISQRGIRILGRVFGVEAPPPPGGFNFTPTAVAGLTRREELFAQTAQPPCQACHTRFDPLGFPYGVFDEQGDYQELDDGYPVDTTGTLPVDIEVLSFENMSDLGAQVASSCSAQRGFMKGFAVAALTVQGIPQEQATAQVALLGDWLDRAFVTSPERSYEDAVRVYAQSGLVFLH